MIARGGYGNEPFSKSMIRDDVSINIASPTSLGGYSRGYTRGLHAFQGGQRHH